MATRDIAAYQVTASDQPYLASLATTTISGRAITGSEKLAQRFVLELMTDLGSMPFAPTRGCSFLTTIRSGALLSEIDAAVAFYTALLQVADNLQAEESEDEDSNARYGSAELRSLTISANRLILSVALYSRTAELTNLAIPIAMTMTQSAIAGLD